MLPVVLLAAAACFCCLLLLALSYRHKLSRRTLLYATVAHDQVRSQPGRKGIELGLRHSF